MQQDIYTQAQLKKKNRPMTLSLRQLVFNMRCNLLDKSVD